MYDSLPFKQMDEQIKALCDPTLFKGLDEAMRSLRNVPAIRLPRIF
jgi:hypothetical protein